jgi:TPR repeat protein
VVVKMLPAGSIGMAAREPAAEPNSFSSRFSGRAPAAADRSEPPIPQLVVTRAPAGQNDDAFSLGLALSGPRDGAAVVISGLAAGATLSGGQSTGPGSWRLSATELDRAAIRPPSGFAGAMEVLAELCLADGTVVERRRLRFERAPPAARRVVRQLDPDETAALIKRGEDYIASGDLASARLVLQRAAESGDARAALALAGTYDPNVLDQLGVKGFAPDVRLALAWYEKARDFGSAEAPRRLEKLASQDH